MKKKIVAIGLAAALCACAFGCGEDGNKKPEQPTDSVLEQIDGLAEDLYPELGAVTDYAGSVDVNLVFGKTLFGWKAVKAAYEKIQPGVDVRLNEHSDGTYVNDVKNAANDKTTDWDIFQGNRLGTSVSSVAYNMSVKIYRENPYCGKEVANPEDGEIKTWEQTLSRDAYVTDKSGSNAACYIMNSESLSTAWFVNKTAFDAAVHEGYSNEDGSTAMPVTWNDLMNLCACMVKAGYAHPLGLAGDSASVNDSQFAWLFRIYGDQYYRDMYPKINVQKGDTSWTESAPAFDFDLEDPQPESAEGYNPSHSRFWNTLLDENSSKSIGYVGAKSDKFACMLENLGKVKQYLPQDFNTVAFEDVRDRFMSAGDDKSAPAVLLDYTGFGLTFGTKDRGFGIDFFDYPAMNCDHAEKHVTTDFVRDVGGNGGYLSVMKHTSDSAQDDLNLDFLMFFLSPYGQSIYYRGLQAAAVAPDGLSTVLNFVVPESWKQFFENDDKISFNGLCDVNWYNNNFIYHVNGQSDSKDAHANLLAKFFSGNGAITPTDVKTFQTGWADAVLSGYRKLCADQKWSFEMYLNPGKGVQG